MYKKLGGTKNVFVNQDEGMFVAFPFTFDEDSATLETETVGGRKYVIEGSLVKTGNIINGITAERYDITEGPVVGRVVVEGWAWKDLLTVNARQALASLPKITTFPINEKVTLNSIAITNKEALLALEIGDDPVVGSDPVTVTYSLNPSDYPTEGATITLTSSKETVLSVNGLVVSVVGAGTAVLTLNIDGKEDSVEVTVPEAE